MEREKVRGSIKRVGRIRKSEYDRLEKVNTMVQLEDKEGKAIGCEKCLCNVFTSISNGRYMCNKCNTVYVIKEN
jgi:hypothetical protein